MKLYLHLVILAITCTSISSFAGSQQEAQAIFETDKITTFAKNVEKYAAQQQARAFIVARVGRPENELPKGIKFTHTAIAVYSAITLDDGNTVKGYAIHNLYQREGKLDKSDLVIDYPVDFFWGAQEMKAGIIIPTPELQSRIIKLIASGENKTLHNENYSVIANPFTNELQNCTEHTLDIINAAIYQNTNKQQLKLNAKQHFSPQVVSTNRFKLALGSIFMDDVTTKDHQGRIQTATFTTIAKYLASNKLATQAVTFDQQGEVVNIL
jgi:hypothetical protein